MSGVVRGVVVAGLLVVLPGTVWAAPGPGSLDELLETVRSRAAQEAKIDQQREREFREAKQKQAELLAQAKAALRSEEQRANELRTRFERNEKSLAELEQQLHERMGAFGELFGVVRQVAGDAAGTFENSLISAQYPARIAFARALAKRKALPSISELEQLWFVLQQEMTESAKNVRFDTNIVAADGGEQPAPVTRVGTFTAVSDGNFLRLLPESAQLAELPRQPATRYVSVAADFEQAQGGMVPMIVDPSRGAIISQLIRAPRLGERIEQGRLVGYVIIGLGVIGLVLVGERFVRLTLTERKIRQQLKSDAADTTNPLGRILAVYQGNRAVDVEALERKIDEAILRETPALERGLPIIRILAVMAPLLGLLGTVIGMIETFQSITLFGTGDPKLMAGGISQALVTTVLGLCAAIPLILLHSLVAGKSKRCVGILEEQSAGLIAAHAEGRA